MLGRESKMDELMMAAMDPEMGHDAKGTVGLPFLSLCPQISADHLSENITRKFTKMQRMVRSAQPQPI